MDSEHMTDVIASIKFVRPEYSAQITPATHLVEELGLDSMDLVEVVLQIEERWAARFDLDDASFQEALTVGALAEFLRGLRSAV